MTRLDRSRTIRRNRCSCLVRDREQMNFAGLGRRQERGQGGREHLNPSLCQILDGQVLLSVGNAGELKIGLVQKS